MEVSRGVGAARAHRVCGTMKARKGERSPQEGQIICIHSLSLSLPFIRPSCHIPQSYLFWSLPHGRSIFRLKSGRGTAYMCGHRHATEGPLSSLLSYLSLPVLLCTHPFPLLTLYSFFFSFVLEPGSHYSHFFPTVKPQSTPIPHASKSCSLTLRSNSS